MKREMQKPSFRADARQLPPEEIREILKAKHVDPLGRMEGEGGQICHALYGTAEGDFIIIEDRATGYGWVIEGVSPDEPSIHDSFFNLQ